MLTATFIHIDKINYLTESKLWGMGYKTWWDVLDNPDNLPNLKCSKEKFIKSIKISIRKFLNDDMEFFARRISHNDYWRILKHYPNQIGYIDIETDKNGEITIIGLYIAGKYISYKTGEDQTKLEWMLSLPDALVSFNGKLFDIPEIKKQYPYIQLPNIHFDLYTASSSVGWQGGLKKLERQFGFSRPEGIKGLTGYDALKLWEKQIMGNKEALDTLFEYNMYDVKNLELLFMRFCDCKMNRLEILS